MSDSEDSGFETPEPQPPMESVAQIEGRYREWQAQQHLNECMLVVSRPVVHRFL